jgi:hypothetical protein
MSNTVIITEAQVPEIINNNVKGAEFFHLSYIKADGSEREANAQLHVSNPRNTELTPKGTGENWKDAMKDGRIKYYEPHHPGDMQGVYRQCRISRLVSMKIRGVTYKVIH